MPRIDKSSNISSLDLTNRINEAVSLSEKDIGNRIQDAVNTAVHNERTRNTKRSELYARVQQYTEPFDHFRMADSEFNSTVIDKLGIKGVEKGEEEVAIKTMLSNMNKEKEQEPVASTNIGMLDGILNRRR